jgi:hypothetical protein
MPSGEATSTNIINLWFDPTWAGTYYSPCSRWEKCFKTLLLWNHLLFFTLLLSCWFSTYFIILIISVVQWKACLPWAWWIVGSSPGRVKSEIYNIGTCGFSARHAALSSKNKEWLARNQPVNDKQPTQIGMYREYCIYCMRLTCRNMYKFRT